jgi:hypothetical protein
VRNTAGVAFYSPRDTAPILRGLHRPLPAAHEQTPECWPHQPESGQNRARVMEAASVSQWMTSRRTARRLKDQ